MSRRVLPLFLVLWVLIGLGGAGLMNAQLRAITPNPRDRGSVRANCEFSVALGIVGGPLSAAVATLFSSGGAYGWSLDWHPVPNPRGRD
jgi:hypothetical protein